jgi:putative holliday junction resolvase
MALDPGSRRIGVAVSDELSVLASPLAVIQRGSRADDLKRLRELVEKYQPSELLIGLPLLPSGDAGPQARQSQSFAEMIERELGLPVRLWNESYSTVEARRRLRGEGRPRQRAGQLDAAAAAVFLQEYLDSRR